jgi:hypothetical protein
MSAPARISDAEAIAYSPVTSDTAARLSDEISARPADNPSRPSMMLNAFVTQAIQTTDTGMAIQPRCTSCPNAVIESGSRLPRLTTTAAPQQWQNSFRSARTDRMSSMNDTRKIGMRPPEIPAHSSAASRCMPGGAASDNVPNTTNTAMTTARPPSRAIGWE